MFTSMNSIRARIAALLGKVEFVLLDYGDYARWIRVYPFEIVFAALANHSSLIVPAPENLMMFGQWVDIADAIGGCE